MSEFESIKMSERVLNFKTPYLSSKPVKILKVANLNFGMGQV